MPERLLGAIRHWFTRERTWTKKTVREGSVSVYDKSYSPKESLVVVLFVGAWATVLYVPLIGIYLDGFRTSTIPLTVATTIATVFSLPLAGVGLILYLLIAVNTIGWVKRESARSSICDECGDLVKNPHTLQYRYHNPNSEGPVFNTTDYEFCSTSCRESWERANREYNDPAWYRIQSKGDQEEYGELLSDEFYGELEFMEENYPEFVS